MSWSLVRHRFIASICAVLLLLVGTAGQASAAKKKHKAKGLRREPIVEQTTTPSAKPLVAAPEDYGPPTAQTEALADADEVSDESQERRQRSGLLLALRVRAGAGLPGPVQVLVSPALEIGYRLPLANGLFGLSLTAGYTFGVASPTGSGHGVRGALRALVFIPAGPGDVRLAAGPTIGWQSISSPGPDGAMRHDASASLGGEASAGYLFPLPAGALGIEAVYALYPYAFGRVTWLAHVLGGEVCYLVTF